MLLPLRFWVIASRFPTVFRGASLHRAALTAASRREFALAETLFEAAALRYRADLMVPALARLRVHQIMALAQACFDEDRDAALEYSSEVERRLRARDVIENPTPPFQWIVAADLLAVWTARFPATPQARARATSTGHDAHGNAWSRPATGGDSRPCTMPMSFVMTRRLPPPVPPTS